MKFVAAGLAVAVVAYYGNPPMLEPGMRFGSRWHALRHQPSGPTNVARKLSGPPAGELLKVRATVPGLGHARVFGMVCRDCGHVKVVRVMDPASPVDVEVFGRTSFGFVWTTPAQVAGALDRLEPLGVTYYRGD